MKLLRAYPASRSLFLTKAGEPLPVGSVLRNPDLARTYSLLAQHGPSYLYDGPLGSAIVNAVDHPVLTAGQKLVTRPGIMTTGDLRAYVARVKAPTRVNYRGLQIDSTPPPSSGGSTVGEALNILSGWNLGTEPRATALFHYLEASRLAYADRDRYVGDPRYVHVPLDQLLSTAFAASRRCLVGGRALKSPLAPGNLNARTCAHQSSVATNSASPERHHTNNIVAVDKQGDIAVYTNTINFFGGSGQTVPRLRLPAQRRADRLRLRAGREGHARSEPAGGRQAAALEHRADDRVRSRQAGVRPGCGGRLDDPDDDLADDRQPRRLRHAAVGCARRAAGQPDRLADLAGRAGVHATVGCAGR